MFKQISKLIELRVQKLARELEHLNMVLDKTNIIDEWNKETGKKFNDIINRYAISEDELLSISETVGKFVTYTRITNIDKYLFKDEKLEEPRLPYTLN